jgi:hypothetical protein
VYPTGGSLRVFRQFAWLGVGSVKLVLSRPTHQRVTPAVRLAEALLAVPDKAYRELFTEPIGELVISDLPLRLLVADLEQAEVRKWIPERPIEKS